MDSSPPRRSPLAFFGLVLLLSLPVYLLSPFVHAEGTPKGGPLLDLVITFVPVIAAVILTLRAEGAAGVGRLLRRAIDLARVTRRRWYLPIFLLGPCTLLLTYGFARLFGVQVQHQPRLALTLMLVLPVVFLIGAAGEELGWTGYVIEPLEQRFGAFGGALVLGVLWWAWHIPSIVQSGQSATLMALGALAAVGSRVVWLWIHVNAGRSIAAVIVVHALANITGSFVPSIPTGLTGPVTAAVAVVVTLLWGARTLARFRFSTR